MAESYCGRCGFELDWRQGDRDLCEGCEMYERGDAAGTRNERQAIVEMLERHGLGVAADLVRSRGEESDCG